MKTRMVRHLDINEPEDDADEPSSSHSYSDYLLSKQTFTRVERTSALQRFLDATR